MTVLTEEEYWTYADEEPYEPPCWGVNSYEHHKGECRHFECPDCGCAPCDCEGIEYRDEQRREWLLDNQESEP